MEFGRIQTHALLYIQHIVFDKLEISTTLKMAAFKSHGAYFLIEYLKQVKGLRESITSGDGDEFQLQIGRKDEIRLLS